MITINLPRPLLTVEIDKPPATLSPNSRACRHAKARAVAAYRRDVALLVKATGWSRLLTGPVCMRATLTATKRRKRDDDNLIGALKAARDAFQGLVVVDDSQIQTLPPVIKIGKRPGVLLEIYEGAHVYEEDTP